MLLYPGLLVQMITTKQPDDSMIEVAIVSMEEALEADGEPVPPGSFDALREPLRLGVQAAPVAPASRIDPPPGS